MRAGVAAGEFAGFGARVREGRCEGASELHWVRAERISGSREAGEC